jgi:stearoyl-CoA desaturase (delta-9 desaturase)
MSAAPVLNPWAATFLPPWAVVAVRAIPIFAVHLALIGLFWVTPTFWDWMLLIGLIYLRGLAITVGYHRYFSHRSFKTSRPMQFLIALVGCTNFQMGPLWWAAHHRHHHIHSDKPDDIHSPHQGGWFWSHLGWAFTPEVTNPNWNIIRDFSKYPELRILERLCHLPGILLGLACWYWGGWGALLIGFCLSTVIIYFMTNSVNSFGHLFGPRDFETRDDSRNNPVLGYLTLGDGWHNNHHHYPKSANHGFYWWQSDISYQMIRLMALFGLAWDVRRAPDCVVYPKKQNRPTPVVSETAHREEKPVPVTTEV